MQLTDFSYDLPPELIAQFPLKTRTASRLLCLDGASGEVNDRSFSELPQLLRKHDLLVFNNTRVIPARLHGHKLDSRGQVEVLIERITGLHDALAHVKASKAPRKGQRLWLEDAIEAVVKGREGDLFQLNFVDSKPLLELLETHGHVPLPPYIKRADEAADQRRYQTVYADIPGAVAAPTAGLHFDEGILETLKQQGVAQGFLTLHVGAGTFQPVRTQHIEEHIMHPEWVEVSAALLSQIEHCKAQGGRVIAVGTTVVRALEAAAQHGTLQPLCGDTRLFITPGFEFHVVDAMLTNFHLPESTLLMLVCAFGGYTNVMHAYQHAVTQGYRFYSYGDCMLLTPASPTGPASGDTFQVSL